MAFTQVLRENGAKKEVRTRAKEKLLFIVECKDTSLTGPFFLATNNQFRSRSSLKLSKHTAFPYVTNIYPRSEWYSSGAYFILMTAKHNKQIAAAEGRHIQQPDDADFPSV